MAAKNKTWTRAISMIRFWFRYIAVISNFEKKVNPITLLKYHKYSIIAAYRLPVAESPVVAVKLCGKLSSAGVMDKDGVEKSEKTATDLKRRCSWSHKIPQTCWYHQRHWKIGKCATWNVNRDVIDLSRIWTMRYLRFSKAARLSKHVISYQF